MMDRLLFINEQFNRLIQNNGGASKTASGLLTIHLPHSRNDDMFMVEFGGYDIGSWPRHCEWGPFKSYDDMIEYLEIKLQEAREIIAEDNFDEFS